MAECKKCHKTFRKSKSHDCDGDLSDSDTSFETEFEESKSSDCDEKEGTYNCDKCEAAFNSSDELESHEKEHIGMVNEKNEADFEIKLEGDLDELSLFKCIYCEAVFESGWQLELRYTRKLI